MHPKHSCEDEIGFGHGLPPSESRNTDESCEIVDKLVLAQLETGPPQTILYANLPAGTLTTWTGALVAQNVAFGPSRRVGFGSATRRSVRARIAGRRYHGWYFESSGDYCRLRRAKRCYR